MQSKKLSERLQDWRAERPDEWKMDEFIRLAERMEEELSDAESLEKAAIANCMDHARFIIRESVVVEIEAAAVERCASELKDGDVGDMYEWAAWHRKEVQG